MYRDTFDRVINFFSGPRYAGQMNRAKEFYFQQTGTVFEDNALYETRMTGFFEWFLLDHPLWDVGVPPIRLYSEICGEKLEEAERTVLRALERTTHSLFEIVGLDASNVKVKDLSDERQIKLDQTDLASVCERGDIFDGRIIPLSHEMILSDVMWLHPREMKPYIVERANSFGKQSRDQFTAFLLLLAGRKWKAEQFKHVPIKQIYSEGWPSGDMASVATGVKEAS